MRSNPRSDPGGTYSIELADTDTGGMGFCFGGRTEPTSQSLADEFESGRVRYSVTRGPGGTERIDRSPMMPAKLIMSASPGDPTEEALDARATKQEAWARAFNSAEAWKIRNEYGDEAGAEFASRIAELRYQSRARAGDGGYGVSVTDGIAELVAKVNSRLTYKDWTIELKMADTDFFRMGRQVELRWSHYVADASTGKPIAVTGRQMIQLPPHGPDDLVETLLAAGIWTVLIGAETHEAMEQFRLGGVCVYDPHPRGGESVVSPRVHEPNLSGLVARLTAGGWRPFETGARGGVAAVVGLDEPRPHAGRACPNRIDVTPSHGADPEYICGCPPAPNEQPDRRDP